MALTALERSVISKANADVLAKIRKDNNLERNKTICLFFKYFEDTDWFGMEKSDAFKTLLEVSLPDGSKLIRSGFNPKNPSEGTVRYLADNFVLSRQRIHQIIKKG